MRSPWAITRTQADRRDAELLAALISDVQIFIAPEMSDTEIGLRLAAMGYSPALLRYIFRPLSEKAPDA